MSGENVMKKAAITNRTITLLTLFLLIITSLYAFAISEPFAFKDIKLGMDLNKIQKVTEGSNCRRIPARFFICGNYNKASVLMRFNDNNILDELTAKFNHIKSNEIKNTFKTKLIKMNKVYGKPVRYDSKKFIAIFKKDTNTAALIANKITDGYNLFYTFCTEDNCSYLNDTMKDK